MKRRVCALLLCAAVTLSLVSCRGLEIENKAELIEEYTRPEAMILVANERNRYQNALSPAVWDVRVNDAGDGFDRLVIQNVKNLLEEVKLLNMLADERGVQLNSQERDCVRQMTDEYFASLTPEDLDYIRCTRDDVQKMYTQYETACKMTGIITGSADADISDSEVKVIKVMQIGTSDLKKAKAILKKIKIDGAGFSSMASRYTETDQIEVVLRRGEKNDLIERTAFSLDEGQVSNILCQDGMYYILQCEKGYDEEATRTRKERIRTAMGSAKYEEVIAPYKQQHKIAFFEKFWSEIDLRQGAGSSADGFFDIFEKYRE